MLLTWLLSAGVVVVILMSPVWLQKHYGFAPAITLQANSIATIMLCIGCLLAGLAADRFGASQHFYRRQPAAGGCQLGILPSCRRQPAAAVSALRYGGALRRRGGGGALCDGAGLPGGSTLHRHLFLLQPVVRDLWRPDADCGHHADGVSPMAPAWYVLALSLMGLGLGIWLRQELTAPTGMPEGELQR